MIKSKKWSTTRKWEIRKEEQKFIDLLKQNGYEIEGVKEYVSKTIYLIFKEGIDIEYVFNSCFVGQTAFIVFEIYYNTKKNYINMVRGQSNETN